MSSPAAKGSNVLYIAHNSQARARGRRWLSPQRKFCGLSFASDSNPSAQPQNYVSCVFVKCLNSESLLILLCKNGDDFGELGWPSSLYCMLGCTLNLHLGVAFSQPGSSLFVVLSAVSRSLGRPADFHNNVLCGLSSWFWNISKHNAHRFELLRKREQLPCTMQCINSHNHRDQRCMRQQRRNQPLKPRALNTNHNNHYKFPKMWTNYAHPRPLDTLDAILFTHYCNEMENQVTDVSRGRKGRSATPVADPPDILKSCCFFST